MIMLFCQRTKLRLERTELNKETSQLPWEFLPCVCMCVCMYGYGRNIYVSIYKHILF